MLCWLFLFFALVCFACSFAAKSMVSLILLWLLALALFVLWAVAQYQAHAGNKPNLPMIDPAEMKRLRAIADEKRAAARKNAAANETERP